MTLVLDHSSDNMDNKYRPAFEGAKFDKSGYCIKHPMIRLCKPIANVEAETLKQKLNYVVVRKTCPMCGEHSLRNERKFSKSRAHGTQRPECQSDNGFAAAHSTKRDVVSYRSSASTASTAFESPPSSPERNKRISSSNSLHSALISPGTSGRRSKNLEDKVAAAGAKLPLPPVRDSRRIRESDASVQSYGSPPMARLAEKVIREDPNASTCHENSAIRSTSRRETARNSASSELDRSVESRSRGRSSTSKTKSSRREDDRASVSPLLEISSKSVRRKSSSRHYRNSEEQVSSSISIAPHCTKKSLLRVHSTGAPSIKSVCNIASSRRGSAPQSFSNLEAIFGGEDFDIGSIDREFSRCVASQINRDDSRSSVGSILSEAASSVTSSQKNIEALVRRRHSIVSSSHMRGRSKSKSRKESNQMDRDEEKSFFSRGRSKSKPKIKNDQTQESSIFSRGRSKSKSRSSMPIEEETEEKSIFSARRSFANSLTRRRSLSRNASRVLKTTSTMDGDKDAEPCIQLYEIPFNPITGRCHYHPEISLAVRDGRKKGG